MNLDQKDAREEAKQIIRHISTVIPEHKIQRLSKKSSIIWNTVRQYLPLDVQYIYDKSKQKEVNALLKSLDQLLNTSYTNLVIKQTLQGQQSLLKVLQTISKKYQEARENQQNQEEENIRQKILALVFQDHFRYGSLSKLANLQVRKKKQYQKLRLNNKLKLLQQSNQLKLQIERLIKFRKYLQRENINFSKVDEIILNRIDPQDQQSFLFSSEISKIQHNNDQLYLAKQLYEINLSSQNSQSVLLNVQNNQQQQQSSILKLQYEQKKQNKGSFKVKQTETNNFQSILIKLQEQEQKQQEECLNFVPINNRLLINPQRIQQRFTYPNRYHNQTTAFYYESNQDSLLKQVNKRPDNLNYSDEMVKRYINQYRFPHKLYTPQNDRYLEINFIMNNQVNPLKIVLQKIKNSQINKYSRDDRPIDRVQVYGSFDNKCGFRKISDININLTVSGLEQTQMREYLFNLRNYLASLVKCLYHPFSLIFKSVICCVSSQQVILSHIINDREQGYRKDPNKVNYIYITINKAQFVESSKFMYEIIYKRQNQHKEIFDLINFLHLAFKRNEVLQFKDYYHTYNPSNCQQKQQRAQSKNGCVNLSIYALHMMILFYLQKTDQICLIKKDKMTKSYKMKQIKLKCLYDNFIEFLKFYSQAGDYSKFYAKKQCIDVIDRDQIEQEKVNSLLKDNIPNFQREKIDYLFVLIHPCANQLMESQSHKKNIVSFQIKKEGQEIFYKKINQLIEKATHDDPNTKWNPQKMFAYDKQLSQKKKKIKNKWVSIKRLK